MEGGQSEIEQKQQDHAAGGNPFQLHAAGDADLPETSSNLLKPVSGHPGTLQTPSVPQHTVTCITHHAVVVLCECVLNMKSARVIRLETPFPQKREQMGRGHLEI